jgi:hypothetical protein
LEELGKYFAAVKKMEATVGNAVVAFEVNAGPATDGRRQAHMAIQLVPMPLAKLENKETVLEILEKEATRSGLKKWEDAEDDPRWDGIAAGVPVSLMFARLDLRFN